MFVETRTAPVSVIIPCYRCRETVVRAVESALNQTLKPTEILLVDDASGDDSLDVLRHLEVTYAPQVKVISLTVNGGPGLARNAGWNAATQPWLAFLDADDAWHPSKIEIQWGWLQSRSDVKLCGHTSEVSTGRIDFPVDDYPAATRISPVRMLLSNGLLTRSVMLRRDLPFRFCERKHAEDYQLWLEIIFSGNSAVRLEIPLAYSFRPEFSPGGLSGQLYIHEKGEIAALRALYTKRKIRWPTYILSVMWSFAKFLRRLWIMRGRK